MQPLKKYLIVSAILSILSFITLAIIDKLGVKSAFDGFFILLGAVSTISFFICLKGLFWVTIIKAIKDKKNT